MENRRTYTAKNRWAVPVEIVHALKIKEIIINKVFIHLQIEENRWTFENIPHSEVLLYDPSL